MNIKKTKIRCKIKDKIQNIPLWNEIEKEFFLKKDNKIQNITVGYRGILIDEYNFGKIDFEKTNCNALGYLNSMEKLY